MSGDPATCGCRDWADEARPREWPVVRAASIHRVTTFSGGSTTTPDATRASLTRLLAWTAIIILTAYLVFLGGGWAGIHSVALRSTSVFLIACVLAVWGAVMIRHLSWRPRSRLMPAFAIALAAFTLGAALSRQPRLGLDYLAYSILLTALYLLLVRLLADPWFRPRVLNLTVLLAIVVGVVYVQVCVAKWIDWWGLVGRFAAPPLRPEFASLTFGNPSAVLTMSALLTIPAVAWIGARTRIRLVASIVLVGLSLVVSLLTGSRAGWLAMAISGGLTAAAWLTVRENRVLVATVIRSRAARIGLGSSAVIGAIVAVALLPGIFVRVGAGGEDLRATYFQTASEMFRESPLHGTGPGTWVAQRVAYTPTGAPDFYIPHAHNIVVQTLAEFGLMGIGAGVVVVAVVTRLVFRGIQDGDAKRRAMAWATVLGLGYFAAHQMLDFYANFPPAIFAAAIPLAWLDASAPRVGGSSTKEHRQLPQTERVKLAVGAVVIAVAVAGLFISERYAGLHDRAVANANEGNWEGALTDARLAAAGDPAIPAYHATLGAIAARTGNHSEAADSFRRAADADDLPDSWLGLAAAEAELGNPAASRDALERALRLGRQQLAILVAAADLEIRLGNSDAAAELYVEALEKAPSLAGDPTPSTRPELRDRWPQIVDDAITALGPSNEAAEIALESGRAAEAAAIVATLDDASQHVWADVLRGWRGDSDAIAAIRAKARAQPFSERLFVWAARLTAREGDAKAAEGFRDWARIVNGSNVREAWEVRVETDVAADRLGVGSDALFYGHYTYRRPTPWEMLPPGLDHLRLE